MHEKPYPPPLEPGVVAHVQMARSASTWIADIEAYLVEHELPTTLAPLVASVMDTSSASLDYVVGSLKRLLAWRPEGTTDA